MGRDPASLRAFKRCKDTLGSLLLTLRISLGFLLLTLRKCLHFAVPPTYAQYVPDGANDLRTSGPPGSTYTPCRRNRHPRSSDLALTLSLIGHVYLEEGLSASRRGSRRPERYKRRAWECTAPVPQRPHTRRPRTHAVSWAPSANAQLQSSDDDTSPCVTTDYQHEIRSPHPRCIALVGLHGNDVFARCRDRQGLQWTADRSHFCKSRLLWKHGTTPFLPT